VIVLEPGEANKVDSPWRIDFPLVSEHFQMIQPRADGNEVKLENKFG